MTAVPDSTDRDPPAQLAADRHCRRQKMLALRPNSRQPQLSLPQSTTLSSSPLQALSFPTTSWSCGTTGPTQAYKLHHRAPCWLHFVHLRRRFTSLSPLMCLPSSTLSSPTSMEPHCVADARFPSSARVRCRARSFDSDSDMVHGVTQPICLTDSDRYGSTRFWPFFYHFWVVQGIFSDH